MANQDIYEIKVQGRLDSHWSRWFDGMTLTYEEDGTTQLAGPVADQAALYGLIDKVRDLGLPLLAVNRLRQPKGLTPTQVAGASSSEGVADSSGGGR